MTEETYVNQTLRESTENLERVCREADENLHRISMNLNTRLAEIHRDVYGKIELKNWYNEYRVFGSADPRFPTAKKLLRTYSYSYFGVYKDSEYRIMLRDETTQKPSVRFLGSYFSSKEANDAAYTLAREFAEGHAAKMGVGIDDFVEKYLEYTKTRGETNGKT
ncbi:hypothetical protein C4573_05345 [Candidatus Woesearchaeota archaeon]|nr:MAG: hypothetical protein C4573_05345 [Candidatus Woesearchaeota archaeon]